MGLYFDERTGWWCAYVRDAAGKRIRPRLARNKTLAKDLLREIENKIAEEKLRGTVIRDVRLSAIRKTFVEWTRAQRKPSTADFYDKYLELLEERWDDPLLSQINRRMIDTFITEKKNETIGPEEGEKRFKTPATVNRYLASLRRLFNKAVEWGNASANPMKGVRLLRENNARVRYLEEKERAALLAHSPPWLAQLVETAIYTGMRQGELFRLSWADVDLDRRQITVRPSKSDTRYLPIPDPLRAVLERIPKRLGNPQVFAREDGSPPINFRKEWDAAVAKAGIKDFTFHDLRHCYASYFMMATGDIYALKDLLGHKTLTMTQRYAHLAPAYKRDLVAKMAEKVATGTLQEVENATQMPHAQAQ